MRLAGTLLFLLLSGCGRYADFTLPPLSGGSAMTFDLKLETKPVLARGAPGQWDSGDVLNPSVVIRNGEYFNLYSGYDGKTWHTGLATSVDGLLWEKRGRVLSPRPETWEQNYIAANGSALLSGSEFLYWYQTGNKERPRIGLARSDDALQWRRVDGPVLDPGPRGSWDERGVADPYVIRFGGWFWMYYLGQDRARRQRLGLARSRSGMNWEKLRSNPVLELGEFGDSDERGLGEPAIWSAGEFYWMLYTGRDHTERRRLGMARSRDGVNWEKLPTVFSGQESWNLQVLCDASVVETPEGLRVWFGGGDVASPDENLHGQIGAGRLITAVPATPRTPQAHSSPHK